jgi:hypothetical protein
MDTSPNSAGGCFALIIALIVGFFTIGVVTTTSPSDPTPMLRSAPVAVQSVTVTVDGTNRPIVQINGVINGCPPNIFASTMMVSTAGGNNTYDIILHQNIPADTACPEIAIDYTRTIALDAPVGDHTVTVNGELETAFTVAEALDYSYFQMPYPIGTYGINSISTPAPSTVVLDVSVTVDGCDFPFVIEQERVGNDIAISVTRDINPAAACTMIAREIIVPVTIADQLPAGTYNVTINSGLTLSFSV